MPTSAGTSTFQCEQCGHSIPIADHLPGSKASCPSCLTVTVVPTRESKDRVRSTLDAGYGDSFGMEDAESLGVSKAVNDTVSEFKSLDYRFLIPFDKIFSRELLRKRAVRWVSLFGLTPIAVYVATLKFQFQFTTVLWLLQVYFCLFWALYFHSLIRPTGLIWRRAITYASFTMVIGIPLLLTVEKLPGISSIISGSQSEGFWPQFFAYVFGVGPAEELCKAAPLLWFALRKHQIVSLREGLFLGLMSGLGFAAVEGVQYTFSATLEAARHVTGEYFIAQMLQAYFRLMSGPVLHGAWAGTVGWFIGVASTQPAGKRWPVVAVGIGLASLLHGLNDVFAGSWLQIVAAGTGILVFMSYLLHGEDAKAAAAGAAASAPE
jgi:RsiW-degrading membrane proteinase PrsW (M82 family)